MSFLPKQESCLALLNDWNIAGDKKDKKAKTALLGEPDNKKVW